MKHIQNKEVPDYDTFIWEWRLEEIIEEMKEVWANLLILWNPLKPSQIYNINEKLKFIWAKAWDRIDLILKIFERNARSKEAKLQIELASIKHMWPRIYDMWMELWKQWGKWKWETNTEIMKRHLAKK
jgi:GTP-binding protein HflX